MLERMIIGALVGMFIVSYIGYITALVILTMFLGCEGNVD